MKNEVYLVVNGEKKELTQEQLRSLGISFRKNPFKRVTNNDYFCINETGDVYEYIDNKDSFDDRAYKNVNYFNDEAFAKQVALHQLLYRKLLKFVYENGFEDISEWNGCNPHWAIRYNEDLNKFVSYRQDGYKAQGVYFSSAKGTKQAIAEVVEPFMKEHPEFVW